MSTELSWIIGLAILFFSLEVVFPASDRPTFASFLFNVASATTLFAVLALLPYLSNPLSGWLASNGLLGIPFGSWQPKGTVELIAATLLYVFVWDFFQYWVHRAEHTFEPLWKIHLFHHEDDRMNSTTSQRNSLLSVMANFFFAGLPTLIICGANMLPMVGAYLFFKISGFFNHANIRINLGPLTPVISGPQWHRLHHGREKQYYNANFAAFFPVLDIVFGTYRRPLPGEFPDTGLTGYPHPRLTIRKVLWRVLALGIQPER
jgi:sterol desaturase/sphingolipid hydroxylase (fatty acid hydroxylase superfamily)